MKRPRGAPQWNTPLDDVELLHPEIAASLPRGAAWRYELKYDGFRAVAEVDRGRVRLRYRNSGDATLSWPEVTGALAALPLEHAVVDGELVVPDASGRPRFDLVQSRSSRRSVAGAAKAAREHPGAFCAFDILAVNGRDLRALPFSDRKERLKHILAGLPPPLFLTGSPFDTHCGYLRRRLRAHESWRCGAGISGLVMLHGHGGRSCSQVASILALHAGPLAVLSEVRRLPTTLRVLSTRLRTLCAVTSRRRPSTHPPRCA